MWPFCTYTYSTEEKSANKVPDIRIKGLALKCTNISWDMYLGLLASKIISTIQRNFGLRNRTPPIFNLFVILIKLISYKILRQHYEILVKIVVII